jgi:two-component system, sensor histidine kinase PdtaS
MPARAAVESEARFRTMADCAPVLLWMAEIDGLCSFFNRGWLEFTGRTIEQELGSGWASGIHVEDFQATMHTYMDSFVARRSFRMEYRLRRHDGVYRWILDHGVPRVGATGAFAGYIGSCIDITDMKDAHTALARALDERELLLKEVHHRVKNNLQVISSLLRLQTRRLEDGRARDVIADNEARVRAIALVHDKLYRSPTFSEVEMGGYAHDLVTAVQQIIGRHDVRVVIESEVVHLGVEKAIPCGLIINELVGNAFKHAFPNGRTGVVRLAVRKLPPSRLSIEVSDDGVGLGDVQDRRKSLGLELVGTLSKQLAATMEVKNEPGTAFVITFEG